MSLHQHPVSKWWKEAVIYQIWPTSFQDSNGDGYGDIRGIIHRLDYLSSLGVSALWISPFYQSPQADNGYDISDYTAVDPMFGTLEDVDELIQKAKKLGIRILLDLVINHTSIEHPWFKESRSSRDNPKADWYFWKDARIIDGKRYPPSNWEAVFKGSVWEWDEHRQQYYLHYFTKEQPDLNWELEEVRQALYKDACLFWLERGVAGFRIDTVNMYSKDIEFPDVKVVNEHLYEQPAGHKFSNGPRLHEFLKEMNSECFAKFDAVTIGELPETPEFHKVLSFVSEREQELDMVLQFDISGIDHNETPGLAHPWKLSDFKSATRECQRLAEPVHEAWAVTFLENHDQGRSVPRYASAEPEYRIASAKMLATYLLTLSGTPIIYQGEELGTINVPAERPIEEYTDIATVGFWRGFKEQYGDNEEMMKKGKADVNLTARDNARAPVQWTEDLATAGFTTGKPWAEVSQSTKQINAAQQEGDVNSVLHFYRKIIKLRKAHAGRFAYGQFELHYPDNEKTMIYSKTHKGKVMLVLLNFTKDVQLFTLPESLEGKEPVEHLSGATTAEQAAWNADLQPYEGRIVLF